MVEDNNEKDLGIFNALANWLKYKENLKTSFYKFVAISLGLSLFLYFLDIIEVISLLYIPNLIPLLAEPIKVLYLLAHIPISASLYIISKVISDNPNPLDKMIEKTNELNEQGFKVTTCQLLKADYLPLTKYDKPFYTDTNIVIVKTKKGETLTIAETLKYLNRLKKELVSTDYKLKPQTTKSKKKSLF